MTVTYTADVSNAEIKAFLKTIFRWRGSLWKLVWHELLIWMVFYSFFSFVYRNAMGDEQKITFEKMCLLLFKYGDFIPFSFMLGYYVTLVVSRWQAQFDAIGWVDKSLMMVSAYVRGSHERARICRRSIARYMCVLQVLVFRSISIPVRRRFPTLDSLVDAGYILPEERIDLEDNKYWLPIKWSMQMIHDAKEEGMITSDNAVQDIYRELSTLRGQLLSLVLADWVPVPLCYTQALFFPFLFFQTQSDSGRLSLSSSLLHPHDSRQTNTYYGQIRISIPFRCLHIPFLSMIQFVIYTGWLKVSEALVNPFGEDDDDFECNWILDRNFLVSIQMADLGAESAPHMEKDANWNKEDIIPFYTKDTVDELQNGAVGSASLVNVPPSIMVSTESLLKMSRRTSMFSGVFTPPPNKEWNEKNQIPFTRPRANSATDSSVFERNHKRKWSFCSHNSADSQDSEFA